MLTLLEYVLPKTTLISQKYDTYVEVQKQFFFAAYAYLLNLFANFRD